MTDQILFGGGRATVTMTHDADGVMVETKQPIPMPTIQQIGFDLLSYDVKELHGSLSAAIKAATGMAKMPKISIEVGSIFGKLLSETFFGTESLTTGAVKQKYEEAQVIPSSASSSIDYTVSNKISFQLTQVIAISAMTIDAVSATDVTGDVPLASEFSLDGNSVLFNVSDAGKMAVMSWTTIKADEIIDNQVLPVVSTFVIPDNGIVRMNIFSQNSGDITVKRDTTALTRVSTGTMPTNGKYRINSQGAFEFASDQTAASTSWTVLHKTDGVSFSSVIATADYPSAGYVIILNNASLPFTVDGVIAKYNTKETAQIAIGTLLADADVFIINGITFTCGTGFAAAYASKRAQAKAIVDKINGVTVATLTTSGSATAAYVWTLDAYVAATTGTFTLTASVAETRAAIAVTGTNNSKFTATTLKQGYAKGDALTLSTAHATPTVGKYDTDNYNVIVNAEADNGMTFTMNYTAAYIVLTIDPPGDGVFVDNKGVLMSNGDLMQRVHLSTPVSLSAGQYTSDVGSYYFDVSDAGKTVYINYEYQMTTGVTVLMESKQIGKAPKVEIDICVEYEGKQALFKFPAAKPTGITYGGTKKDDFSMMKFEFTTEMKDVVSREIGTISLSA